LGGHVAIFAGIITDAFGKLRQESELVRQAAAGYCYCCSHKHHELEGSCLQGFDGHINSEHNVWHYVSMMIHLEDKLAERHWLTDTEAYFFEMHSSGRLDELWPIKRALCIDGTTNVARGLDQVIKLLQGLSEQTTSTSHSVTKLGSAVSTLSRLSHLRIAALLHAASDGNISEMESLITKTNVDVNSADYDGRTALHLAAAEGQQVCDRFHMRGRKQMYSWPSCILSIQV